MTSSSSCSELLGTTYPGRAVVEDELVARVGTPLRRIAAASVSGKEVQPVVVLPADALVAGQRRLSSARLHAAPGEVAQVELVQRVLVALLAVAAKEVQLAEDDGAARAGALQWNITAARLLLPAKEERGTVLEKSVEGTIINTTYHNSRVWLYVHTSLVGLKSVECVSWERGRE